jgi:tRNA threonylcarbamoyladenosine biosynthesis protein TsaB
MRCLAVNTATSVLSVALVEDDNVLSLFETRETRDQGNLLLKHIQSALDDHGLTYADIDLLAAVTGPGSFTGIRIGLAALRGLALATGKPIVGVSSFDMFAEKGAPNIIAVESWREELYFRYGDITANETPEDFARRIGQVSGLTISGDAAEKIVFFFPQAKVITEMPNAVTVARIAMKNPVGTPPTPYYLRGADVTMAKCAIS